MNYLGLSSTELKPTVKEINRLLSNYQIYYQNLRNFHWNIEGKDFFDLHEKFEELYTDAHEKIDEIAERILTLRFRPLSSLASYLQEADLDEARRTTDTREMMETILKDHRVLIENLRAVIKEAGKVQDEGTIDLMGGMLENLEKESWMLDAWLVKKEAQVEEVNFA